MDLAGEDRTLRRIMATLVALAVLAERSAARSFPIRWLVLVLLRHAQAVVLGFIAEATGMDFSFDDDPEAGSSPLDAAVLAWRLRTLAAALGAWLTETCRLDGWTPGIDAAPRGGRSFAYPVFIVRFGSPRRAYDTS